MDNIDKLENVLKEVAISKGLKNYKLEYYSEALGGDGFLSECHTGYIIDKDTGSKIEVFVKISLPMLGAFTSWAYRNEYHFYTSIFPELNKFQSEKGVKHTFQNIPEFYCGNNRDDEKYVAMDNIKSKNYIMTEKSQTLDKDHLKVLFQTYGKYHALSFSFKEQNFENYSKMVKPLKNLFIGTEGRHILGAAKQTFSAACNAVKEIDVKVAKKLQSIEENFDEMYVSAATYNGKYSGLSHGDCWSNNVLFKYEVSFSFNEINATFNIKNIFWCSVTNTLQKYYLKVKINN